MIENIGSTTELYCHLDVDSHFNTRHLESDNHYNNNDCDSVMGYTRTPEPPEECVQNIQQECVLETNDWKNLALILDRLSALIFVFIFVIGHLAILCQFHTSQ